MALVNEYNFPDDRKLERIIVYGEKQPIGIEFIDNKEMTLFRIGQSRSWNDYVGIPVPIETQINYRLEENEKFVGF